MFACCAPATTVANDGNPIRDETGTEATPFSYGSGHVNPVDALDPGLVYDTTLADYTNFLCSLKLTHNPVQDLPVVALPNLSVNLSVSVLANLLLPLFNAAGEPCACRQEPYDRPEDMNYPSIAVPVLNYGVGFAAEFPRTVTNVGPADSVYRATVTTVPGVEVAVTPDELAFSAGTKKLSFKVSVSGTLLPANGTMGASASVVWSDGRHHVRSPIYVFPHKHVM